MAYAIPPLPPADPQRQLRFNPLKPAREGFRMCGQIQGLPAAIFGHALYWFIGAALVFSWNEMGEKILNREQGDWTFKLATLSVSTAMGCIIAGRLCKETIPLNLPRIGGWALASSFIAVAMGPRDPNYIWAALAFGSFFAGLYLIPLRTWILRLPSAGNTGRALGISQFSDWTGIVLASFAKSMMAVVGMDAIQVFWVLGVLLAIGTWKVTLSLRETRLTIQP
jgi:MFS-type transporter involved in bile tolerance (Atg22 family)